MEKKHWSIVYSKSDEEFIALFKDSHTLTEFAYRLGMVNIGGDTFQILKSRMRELSLDSTKQFAGWRRLSAQRVYVSSEEYFAIHTKHAGHSLLRRLLKEGLKEKRCEICGNEGEWNGKPLALQVHHRNGDHFDNRLENLEILCPNCHAQTENNDGKNIKRHKDSVPPRLDNIVLSFSNEPGVPVIKKKLVCKNCGKPITRWSKTGLCKKCVDEKSRKVSHPSKEELLFLIQKSSVRAVAKHYGIGQSSVRKWCKKYGLPTKEKALKEFVLD